ncbi:MAG: vitamin K epoxide reductase family protein [Candidatus Micrarchaeales archaeon]
MQKINNLVKAQLLLSLLGLAISIYLTIAHYFAALPVICPTVGIVDCGTVLGSSFAVIFGIPSSALGIVFFIVMIALLVRFDKEIQLYWNIIGFLSLFYFWYAEYMLGKICLYCTAIHVIVILLLISAVLSAKKKQ